MDVAFADGQMRARTQYAAHNLAVLKQLVLNLFRLDPTGKKGGIKTRRLVASTSDTYRAALLGLGQPSSDCPASVPWKIAVSAGCTALRCEQRNACEDRLTAFVVARQREVAFRDALMDTRCARRTLRARRGLSGCMHFAPGWRVTAIVRPVVVRAGRLGVAPPPAQGRCWRSGILFSWASASTASRALPR